MSRPLRIEYPNAWHLIMNPSGRGQELFTDRDDHICFLDLLPQTSEMLNIKKLHGYTHDTWRYRIGKFGLFYIVDQEERVVYILTIDDRKDVYK